MGVHALAQGRTGRNFVNAQCLDKEVITPKFLNGIEVVLALHQQAQVGLQNVAVGDTTDTYRELAVNAITDSQALHVLTHQRQSGVGSKVVGEFFENKVSHVGAHLQGDHYFNTQAIDLYK